MSNEDNDTTEILSLITQVSTQLAEAIRLVKENAKRIDEMEAQILGANDDRRLVSAAKG